MLGQLEVDGRNGGDGINAQALGMSSQLHAVGGVVAGHVGDHGQLALGLAHHSLQGLLALFLALVNALAGGTANVYALNALLDEVAGQLFGALNADVAFVVIAGVKRGNNALVLGNVFHVFPLLFWKYT